MKATANSSRRNNIRAARGFTLLEVMIALAVTGIALVSLLGLANRSIAVSGYLQLMTQATLLAQEKMSEIEAGVIDSSLGLDRLSGTFDPPFSRYQWRTETEGTPLPAITLVRVIVAWGDEEKNESVDLTSFVFLE